ncbi:hypothetical protein QAD02_003693, partial [Eretmocerus hayati]
LLQDVTNSAVDICDDSVGKRRLVASWGQSIHLGCFVKMPEILADREVKWYHYSKKDGRYEVTYGYGTTGDKFIETSEKGLVIIGLNEQDAGRYDCWLSGVLLCSYNITVETHRCSSPARTNDYQRIYSDWCHEFEKYKSGMKNWEKKQSMLAPTPSKRAETESEFGTSQSKTTGQTVVELVLGLRGDLRQLSAPLAQKKIKSHRSS